MFDPSKFRTATPSPTIGNSEHPVARYVTSLSMRWFDATNRVAVVGLKDLPPSSHYADCKAVTYRPADSSIQFHRLTPKELKARWDAGGLFDADFEVLDIPETGKYIGNVILREIEE